MGLLFGLIPYSAHGNVVVVYENPFTTANCGIRISEAWLLWTAQYLIGINQSESMFTVRC